MDLLRRGCATVALAAATTLTGACTIEATCVRESDAARVVALEDAVACRWAPDDLPSRDCRQFDDRLGRAYAGVWCSTAAPACLASQPDAEGVCFGAPARRWEHAAEVRLHAVPQETSWDSGADGGK